MGFQQALEKGFLNLSEEEAGKVIDELFDTDNTGERFDGGLALLMTFVPEEKLAQVLDLAAIVLDAHEELEYSGEEHSHEHLGEDDDDDED